MIGQKFNFDEVFFRDLTVCVLDTLEGRLNWINRFTSGDVSVQVPIYYSLSGDERFLLDSFQDDVVSENRYVELNTDQIPRGHLTLNNFNIRSDEFRNPNVWLRAVVEDNVEVKKLLKKVRAIPITVTYDLVILLKSEVDVFKCAQEIMNTLWLYRFIYFEHNYMNIDAVLTMPDSDAIEITREKNLKSDNTIKLTLSLEVQTYYPAFTSNKDCRIDTIGTSVCSVDQTTTNVIKVGPVFSKNCIGSNKKVSSLSEVAVGNQIIGNSIPNGTYVTDIDIELSQVKISKNITCDLENSQVSFLQDPGTVVMPYRTRWFNNLQPLLIRNAMDTDKIVDGLGKNNALE
jgi:hypothetical protein